MLPETQRRFMMTKFTSSPRHSGGLWWRRSHAPETQRRFVMTKFTCSPRHSGGLWWRRSHAPRDTATVCDDEAHMLPETQRRFVMTRYGTAFGDWMRQFECQVARSAQWQENQSRHHHHHHHASFSWNQFSIALAEPLQQTIHWLLSIQSVPKGSMIRNQTADNIAPRKINAHLTSIICRSLQVAWRHVLVLGPCLSLRLVFGCIRTSLSS